MKIRSSALLVCFIALLPLSHVFGQRNYATTQTSGKTGGAEVKDPASPVTFPDLNDPSKLKVDGLLESAYQILRFPATVPAHTPVTIRLRWKSNISLLGRLTVEPMLDGDPVSGGFPLGPPLVLLGSGDEEEVNLDPGSEYNGVRISLAAGLLSSAEIEIYYAYYLDDPEFSVVQDPVCTGNPAGLQILNFRSGYRYHLYTSETAAAPVTSTTTDHLMTPPVTAETTFFVEATEGSSGAGISRRLPVTIRVKAGPQLASIAPRTLCEGETLDLSTLNPAIQNGDTGGSYQWSLTSGGTPLAASIITPAPGAATYWVTYTVNGCSDEKSVVITTTPRPGPITISMSKN